MASKAALWPAATSPRRAPHAPPCAPASAADDVADGEDVRHVGAHLRIDVDETAVGDDDAGLLGADLLAVRRAAGGLQDHVVTHGLGRRGAFALELDPQAIFLGVDGAVLVLSMMRSKRWAFCFSHLHGVGRALHQAVHHLDDVNLAPSVE